MTLKHDRDLASRDDFVVDEAAARLVDQHQGDVAFCDDPDCDAYTSDLSDLTRDGDNGYFCANHSAVRT